MVTGSTILGSINTALDDKGDPSQDSSGASSPVYFWSTTEKLLMYNAAVSELYEQLINLKRDNALKNMTSSFTGTTLPGDYYKAYAAQVNGQNARLALDPLDPLLMAQSISYGVSIFGLTVIITGPPSATCKVFYYKLPATVANNTNPLTDFAEDFYMACIPLAVFFLCHKDLAQSRVVLRRSFGTENQQMFPVIRYLQSQL